MKPSLQTLFLFLVGVIVWLDSGSSWLAKIVVTVALLACVVVDLRTARRGQEA